MKSKVMLVLLMVAAAIIFVSCDSEFALQEPITVTGIHNQTQHQVYETIAEAIENADEGDKIYVGPGTYDEELTLNQSITLKGFGNPQIQAVTINSSDVHLEGFTIKTEGTGITITHATSTFEHITIKNNTIDSEKYGVKRGNHGAYVESFDKLTNLSIVGNHFSGGISEDDNQGIMLFTRLAGTTRIENNTFKDKLAALNAGYIYNIVGNLATDHYATGDVYIQHNVVLDDVEKDPPQYAIWVANEDVMLHKAGNKVKDTDVTVTVGYILSSDD
jgi:hypothetical protein